MPTATTTSRATRSRLFLPAIAAVLLAMVTALVAPAPADAARTMTIRGEGSQNSGRWQVFDLPAGTESLDAVAWWDNSSANVNIFVKDANNRTIAHANGSGNPEWVRYDGAARPAKIAVLVKSGRTDYRVYVHQHGTAPWINENIGDPDEPDPDPDPDPPAAGDYPGEPAVGTVLFGSSLAGNRDPWDRHERASGERVGVHRMYFRWDQRAGYMIRLATEDARVGRVPWVSVKNNDWRGTGNGNRDGEIDQMLRGLKAIDGPVWLTVHHEPEGGEGVNSPDGSGGAAAHLAMNRRVRQRMNALGVDNVALVPILMAWSWDRRSGRNPDEWWDSNVYDFIGVDTYDRRGDGLFSPYWYDVRDWAGRKNVDVAVAEWGLEGSGAVSANRLRQWHSAAINSHNDGDGGRVVALAAYDNSTGGWVLEGQQLTTFRELVGHPNSSNP